MNGLGLYQYKDLWFYFVENDCSPSSYKSLKHYFDDLGLIGELACNCHFIKY